MIENPFRRALFPGLAMIGLAVILIFINPLSEQNLPDGFETPIIAFEFMQNAHDVVNFFQVKDVEDYRGRMLLGNKVDYIFMVIYSLFLTFVGIGFYKVTKLKFVLMTAILLPIVICLSDVMENINIGMIVEQYEYSSIQQELQYLNVFTWVKWTGIASLLLIYSSFILKKGGLSTFTGGINVLAFIACVVSFFLRGPFLEIMATLVMVSFLLYFIGAWNGFGYLRSTQSISNEL